MHNWKLIFFFFPQRILVCVLIYIKNTAALSIAKHSKRNTSLLFIRWSWRESVGEAAAARWPWTTSPWRKAPARRSTIWGDSNKRNQDGRQRGREKENTKREDHLKENWLCCDKALTLPEHQAPPPPRTHHVIKPSRARCTASRPVRFYKHDWNSRDWIPDPACPCPPSAEMSLI